MRIIPYFVLTLVFIFSACNASNERILENQPDNMTGSEVKVTTEVNLSYQNTSDASEKVIDKKECVFAEDCVLLTCSGCFNIDWLKTAPPDLACRQYEPSEYSCDCVNHECVVIEKS